MRARRELGRAVPVPLGPWREVGGRVVLERPRPSRRGWAGMAERFSYWASVRRVRLDDVGSAAWRRIDGRRTVAEVACGLGAEEGGAVVAAEERVGLFVRELARLGFLELRVPVEG